MFLPRHRKTESKLLWWTKIIVLFILLSGLIGYIVELFRLIIIEEPSIEYSYRKLDPILPPDLPDIGANYPNQIPLKNFITDFIADKTFFIKENTRNVITYKQSTREYLFRDWTNYLGFPNYYIKLPLLQITTSVNDNASPVNYTQIQIKPHGELDNMRELILETVETEKR
ncbi:hypothetical protein C2G38_2180079 [Gigaspora rosea]|uniref:Uncharacterized protein n=1 Tax=Gigaspora rosea TaxID=44941 RepID=A0A397VDP2_9GLOM|nr:hypothetical protein C2G38_2180079 [Gigaspora rosea]